MFHLIKVSQQKVTSTSGPLPNLIIIPSDTPPTFAKQVTQCLNNLLNSANILSLLLLATVLPAHASLEIRVSPIVNNATTEAVHPITLEDLKKQPDTPITLAQALTILKDPALRDAAGAPKDSINIRLDPGIYRLTETLRLDATSSGTSDHPVSISGPQGATAILSGGRAVNGFTAVSDPAILARLPAAARAHVLQTSLPSQGITDYGRIARHGFGLGGKPAALEVFYREQLMPLARWPNEGFAKIATTPDGKTGRTFTVEGTNLKAWQGEPNPLATGYWFYYWADETTPLDAIDPTTGRITLPAPGPGYGLKPGQPVFFQNLLAELDQPGEWYLDRKTGVLYFWPPQPLRDGDVEVSLLDHLLVVNGASHIQLAGLTFENARGDAITVRGGHHISIAHSIIHNIGNHGAVISGQDNGLADMTIENIGEGGVVLNSGDRKTLKPGNLYVERSKIQRYGRLSRTYQPAILMSGVGNRAVSNRISNAPHTAILFSGNNHLISNNEIFEVCKETGDAGAIYTGRDWTARGTVIANNYLHDIPPNTEKGGTIGVYLDDQASGIIVRGNLIERVSMGVLIGGGRDNLIEDNKFVDNALAIHLDARGKTWQKTSTDDPNWPLRKRLTEVPYTQSPYKERYPNLSNLLDDEPGTPKYNVTQRNIVSGGKAIEIKDNAEAGISTVDFDVLPKK